MLDDAGGVHSSRENGRFVASSCVSSERHRHVSQKPESGLRVRQ